MNPLPDFPGDVDPFARMRADRIALAVVRMGMYTVPMIVLNKPYVRIVGPAAIVVELAPEFSTVYTFYGTPVPDEVREALRQADINPEYEVLHSPRNPAAYVLNLPFAWPHPDQLAQLQAQRTRTLDEMVHVAYFLYSQIDARVLRGTVTNSTAGSIRSAFTREVGGTLTPGMERGLELLELVLHPGSAIDHRLVIEFMGLLIAEADNPGRGHEALQE